MKQSSLLIVFILVACNLFSQSVSLNGLGVTLGPSLGNRITKSSSSDQVTPFPGYRVNYQQMDDSLDKVDGVRAGFDFGINASFTTYSRTYFTVGIGYRNTGYRRRFKDLKYRDSIQYMGEIDVLSDNGPKNITFNYRYQYLELPILFHYSLKKREDQYNEENHFITFGIAPNWLIKNTYNARLFGFSIEERVNFSGKEIFYTNRAFNLNAMLGGRFQTSVDEDWRFNISPVISFPLLSQTVDTDGTIVRPWTFMLNAGFTYKIQ